MSSRIVRRIVLTLALCAGITSGQNDRCFNAILIGDGLTTGNTTGATAGGSDSVSACALQTPTADLWYRYVAPCTGKVTATTCSPGFASFDTVISAWDGQCGCGALVLAGCNDDSCSVRSTTVFPVIAGRTYYIEVGGFGPATGSFGLSVSCSAVGVPANDFCVGAIPIEVNQLAHGHNIGATTSAPGICGNSANDVWYSFILPAPGYVTVTTCHPDTDFDTVLAVWGGNCGNPLLVDCNDDSCGLAGAHSLNSTLTILGSAGAPYYISVGGYFGAVGSFALRVSSISGMSLKFFDAGPGTIGYRVRTLPGYYYVFLTTAPGAYPNGWFHGIDITIADLFIQLYAGFPFNGPATDCGTVGPFGGLPAGFSVYGVALGAPSAGALPEAFSPPASFTIF